MKARLSVIAYCTGAALMLAACAQTATTPDYTVYVNPFIGTGGHGHTFPGPVVPHGMIPVLTGGTPARATITQTLR